MTSYKDTLETSREVCLVLSFFFYSYTLSVSFLLSDKYCIPVLGRLLKPTF